MKKRFSLIFYCLMGAFGFLFLLNLFDFHQLSFNTDVWLLYFIVPLYLLGLHLIWSKVWRWNQSEIERVGSTDPQTHLLNSSQFLSVLEGEIDRSRRKGYVLSLLYMDIDYFSRYNQTYGMNKGNAVLDQMGHLLKSNTRKYDYCFRFGNDEFACILPETDKVQARIVAERVRELFYSTYAGDLALSVGLVSLAEGDDTSRLFRKSEAAMIEARRDGGNRIRAYVDRGMI